MKTTEIKYYTDENTRFILQSNYTAAETWFWGYMKRENMIPKTKYDIGIWCIKLKNNEES